MAANETVNTDLTDVESVVNRWILDYYGFLALKCYENDQYEHFCGVRAVLDKILARPVEETDATRTKIQVLKFLSRINEGEDLELVFEHDQSICPLESALIMLEKWPECKLLQDFEKVCTSVKEMMVRILIKNSEFDKAREALNKHFPTPMVGKKAIFMSLIRQKNKTHKYIQQIDFHQFKVDMMTFCKKLCTFDLPFLHKAAKQAIHKRLEKQDDTASDVQDDSSSGLQMNNINHLMPRNSRIITKSRMKAAIDALAAGSHEKLFAQVEEELEGKEQGRKTESFMCLSHTLKKSTDQDNAMEERQIERDSGSPMEASPADQPPQTDSVRQIQAVSKTPSVQRKRWPDTVAQLVIGPDSQTSSQCTFSEELETEVGTKEPAQSAGISSNNDLQCPLTEIKVTVPTRNLPRQGNKTSTRDSSLVEVSEHSEEENHLAPESNGEICVENHRNLHRSSFSRKSTKSKEVSSESEDPQESCSSLKTPKRKPRTRLASSRLSKQIQTQDPGTTDNICITDSSLDGSPHSPDPQTSSTPHKVSAQDKDSSHSKWRRLFKEATETKETWSDEESSVNSNRNNRGLNESTISNSGSRKRKWTNSETYKLKEGVRIFGEGNWSKIKAHYGFKDRTNVNLKDRWRTMKNSKMI